MTLFGAQELEVFTRKLCKSPDYQSPVPDADELGVRVLRTIDELEEVREVWNSWCSDPNPDVRVLPGSC
jgi:hypothetical protein